MPQGQEVAEGFLTLTGGMNAGMSSDIIPPTQYARGVNITSRYGKARTRPVLTELSVTDSKFTTGKFQGCALYHLNAGDHIIVGIAGNVLGIELDTLTVTDYTAVAGITLDATVDHFYFQQADKYMVVQDGQDRPLIIEIGGAPSAFQASGDQVPTGTKMAYGHGRLSVVVSQVGAVSGLGERFFVVGDILLPNNPTNVLNFKDTEYLSGGGAFGLPEELGFITSMKFIRNVQSGSGLGSLIVFAQHGAAAFGINAQRSIWQDIDISQVLFTGSGIGSESPFASTNVNNDIVYRSKDGIRTLGYSAAVSQGQSNGLANDPLSIEVERDILELDTLAHQYYTSSVFVNNRMLMTAVGADDGTNTYFKALVSLDASVVSSFGATTRPVFDGIWTGLKFAQLCSGRRSSEDTVFVFARDESNANRLFYLNESGYQDGINQGPVCRLYTRTYGFEQGISTKLKTFQFSKVWLSDIKGTVTLKVYYRPHGFALWNETNAATVCSTATGLNQRRRAIKLTPSNPPCDPTIKALTHKDTDFQFCVEITGHARIEKALFYVSGETDVEVLACKMSSTCVELEDGDAGDVLDDYEYEIV